MTNEEKFKAIVERLKAEGWCDDPSYVSVMMIIHYLDQLQKEGIVECAFNMTELGRRIAAICEEFDWQPSNIEIQNFVDEMVEKQDRPAFCHMIQQWRDNREGLLEEFAEVKRLQRGF